MDSSHIEDVVASLVRDYLQRKGCNATLQTFKRESNHLNTVENTRQLILTLHLDDQMARNKELPRPYKTVLEVLTHSFLKTGTNGMDKFGRTGGDSHSWLAEQKAMASSNSKSSVGAILKPTGSGRANGRRGRNRGAEMRSIHQPSPAGPRYSTDNKEDLVLEDTAENSETVVGEGMAGLLKRIESPTESPGRVLGHTRPEHSKGLPGLITSTLTEADKRRQRRQNQNNKPLNADSVFSGSEDRDIIKNNNDVLQTSSSGPTPTKTESPTVKRTPQKKEKEIVFSGLLGAKSSDSSAIGSGQRLSDGKVVRGTPRRSVDQENLLLADNGFDLSAKSVDKSNQESSSGFLSNRARGSRHSVEKTDDITNSNYSLTNSSFFKDENPNGKRSSPTSTATKPTVKSVSHDIKPTPAKNPPSSARKTSPQTGLGDLDDFDEEKSPVLSSRPKISAAVNKLDRIKSTPIDGQTALDLRTLIFGNGRQKFSHEWKCQSFTFCEVPRIKYGLMQKKGGPCGVVASVQAHILRHLFFSEGKKVTMKSLDPPRADQSEAVAVAIATILWQAGQENSAIVTLPSNRTHFHAFHDYLHDNFTERLVLHQAESLTDLTGFIRQNLSQFEMEGTSGAILVLYSAILSRTIKAVRGDFDVPASTLMGSYDYCTQEMVNLLLVGKAVSNVFNDTVELDSGGDEKTILRGIHGRTNIGFLSLFEHYKSCEVGSYMKTPRYPIWVLCSESHFSVLFSLNKELMSNWKAERRFDLYYYDPIANQGEQIRLTIDTTNKYFQMPSDEDLVPPIDHCIRTKWAEAEIDWNGVEPLL